MFQIMLGVLMVAAVFQTHAFNWVGFFFGAAGMQLALGGVVKMLGKITEKEGCIKHSG